MRVRRGRRDVGLIGEILQRPSPEELDFVDDPGRDAFQALFTVQCLEHGADATVPDADNVADMMAEATEASPLFGPAFAQWQAWCVNWPVPQVTLPRIDAPGAAPLVVIGTTGDATTPYVWSQRTADALESGVLVTFEDGTHGAGGSRGAECIDTAVTAYLIDGEVPEDGLTCGASV